MPAFLGLSSARSSAGRCGGLASAEDRSHKSTRCSRLPGGWSTLNLTAEGAPPFRVCFLKGWAIPQHREERIAEFPAGFHDFSGEALRDFDRFGDAAAFGHQSRNIRAGTQIAAILQILDANPNGHFLDFRDVLLPLHGRFLCKAL